MTQPNNGKPIDLEFYKVKRKVSQKQIEANRKSGKIGGQVSGIKKGFSAMSEERKKEIQAMGVKARKIKNDLKGKDLHE